MSDKKSHPAGLDEKKYRAKGLDDLMKYHVEDSPFSQFIKNELRWISIAKEIIKDPEMSSMFPPTIESINELVEVVRNYEFQKHKEKIIERAIARVNASG